MKKLELMAIEYADSLGEEYTDTDRSIAFEGYLAGFHAVYSLIQTMVDE